jgi:hypothetical protein
MSTRSAILALCLAAACSTDGAAPVNGAVEDGGSADGGAGDGDGGGSGDTTSDGEYAAATRADLRLVRWRQLLQNLEGGLALTADQVCREAGLYDCADLHVVPLGGVSVANGLYRPIDAVAATTSMAMERVVLQACWNRLSLDRELAAADEPAVVFGALDLLTPDSTAAGRETVAIELYRRLVARDPLAVETAALEDLYGRVEAQGAGPLDWAALACFAVGTTTEALTY